MVLWQIKKKKQYYKLKITNKQINKYGTPLVKLANRISRYD